jgi:hypothetical protein
VERFFRAPNTLRRREGISHSEVELEADIAAYNASHNVTPKPIIGTSSASDILVKVPIVHASFNKIRN